MQPKTQAPFENPNSFGVYIHFPYCERICSYCDFVVTATPEIPHALYADAILTEFRHRAHRFDDKNLVSIYFGGGTPSLWAPKQIERIIYEIVGRYGNQHLQEVTVEANPSAKLKLNLDEIASAGVSRISLGVQTLNNETLRTLRRTHTNTDALRDLEAILCHSSFRKTSADLIYGLPGSSVASVTKDAQKLCDLGVEHLSMYALTLEEGTPLTQSVRRNTSHVPSEEHVIEQAEAIWETVHNNGLVHYEISSASVPGNEAIHNSLYWHQRGYLGLGVGAHGLEPAAQDGKLYEKWVFRENNRKVKRYVEDPIHCGQETFHNRTSWLQDLLIVRPRWLQGFHEEEIYAHTTETEHIRIRREIRQLENEGILTQSEGRLRLSPRGILFADSVTERLVPHIGHQATIEHSGT